ncbi:PfkB family carbohydrate kinase [Embleya sp. NPDC005971]|uniref:PfkB family carbohydrate kinase n=1 Tax=Embleya sp. NPDC005971 TaxID=3156724 RepID=UPI00340B8FA1
MAVVGSLDVGLTRHRARLPSPGETVSGRNLLRPTGGKGVNRAVAAARLGRRVAMFGRVGTDPAGSWPREAEEAEQVEQVEQVEQDVRVADRGVQRGPGGAEFVDRAARVRQPPPTASSLTCRKP